MSTSANLGQTYAEQGFVSGIDIFNTDEIDHFRSCFDQLEASEGREKCQIGLQARHLTDEFIWKLATDRRILDAMQEVMGQDLLLLSTHFFCKYPDPEGKKFVAWHQDVTYWGLEPAEAHTAWIAIDDADIENGCMQAILSSHKDGIAAHDKSDKEGNLLSINQAIPDELVDTSKVVNLALKAGQISIHDGQLYHASNPNISNRRRCGLTVRFIAPHVKQVQLNSTGDKWPTILVRGQDEHHNFPAQEMPFPLP
ncbi:MAG: ectoine hydroxylase-related dioxygenase (phytanoyl-CoA dioxygenase family) [Candidatus Latescibacterota bacterium]|jgi:ectoine hydroxylase-related dioxygenase (phytanoyl-CoA dioxygenase family)